MYDSNVHGKRIKIMICYVIIYGNLILNLFLLTYDDILYPKCLLYIYVLHQNGPRRPKHVEEIIITKKNFMHEYLQLVGINIVLLLYCTEQVQH